MKKYKAHKKPAPTPQEMLDRITVVDPENTLFFIEEWVDGFGADTWVKKVFPTLQEAQDYVLKKHPDFDVMIIGGNFGKEIRQYYD